MIQMSILLAGLTMLSPVQAKGADAPWAVGMDQISRLDLLPAFKRSVKIGAVTSYDRTGGNDDGFSGKYSFVRKEGDTLVLADLKGPGCIYRIHTPTPTDEPIEFYFDGETTPRLALPYRELFTGTHAPFLRPLVDIAGGGAYSYVPIPYKKSCKVVLRAKSTQFYDLNYATYPDNAPISSFNPSLSEADKRGLDVARAAFSGGRDSDLTKYNVPAGTKLTKHPFDLALRPGKSVTLFQSSRPGRIASIRLGPASSLVSKERDVLLRITWDGDKKPSVLCPAGDFFGYAWGKPSMGSALVGTYDGENYCNFPMPFDRAAKIELVSLRQNGGVLPLRGEIVVGDTGRRPYEGKFYAVWRRESPTSTGKPFTFLNTKGRGHIVGLALQAQGKESGNTFFFEGDDTTTVDGELLIHGTGSEDSFNGGWYDVPGRWDGPVARPFSGCMLYQRYLGRTGGYRFMIGDAYSYGQSILQTIEHGPERDELITDYTSVTYLYSENPPTNDVNVLDRATRTVVDPEKAIFAAHWSVPIASFSFADATLSRRSIKVGTEDVRALSLRPKGEDFFGPPFISLGCDLPAVGKYRVYLDVVKGPDCGKVQLFQDEAPLGEAIDLYDAKASHANGIYVGEISAVEGLNNLMFKIVGKNAAATGLGFDLVNIVCTRV